VETGFDYNRIDPITVMRLRVEPRAHNVTTHVNYCCTLVVLVGNLGTTGQLTHLHLLFLRLYHFEMVLDGTEAKTTTTNANTKTSKDTDGTSSPSSPLSPTLTTTDETATSSTGTSTSATSGTSQAACRPEHAFHAFDTLYCALTPHARPVEPLFGDDK
jgi:hypothetical protein